MRLRLPFALGPVARVSLGVLALFVSLVLIADMVLGIIPPRTETELLARHRVAENVAAQTSVLLTSADQALLVRSLQQVMSRNRDLLSVAVRRAGGGILVQRGDHDRHWEVRDSARSRLNHLQVQLYSGGKPWGWVEMAFAPAGAGGVLNWLREPAVQFYSLLIIGGFLLCFFYLRRVMQYLDPSAAVPERVRAAFDTLSDGVVVLDAEARIMLANRAFRALHPDGGGEMQGRAVRDLQWLPRHVGGEQPDLPWTSVLSGQADVPDARMSIMQPDGKSVEAIVRCAPVRDGGGRMRGCIVTFHDVTEVYEANDRLRETLGDLERTREQIHTQNEELRRLAMRDPMTGCLNRRAFFDAAADLADMALGGDATLCCIMTDIDHFKGFNDLYGHSVGDQVIQVVARALAASIRNTDLLCRYGGEEFCILLPNTSLADACVIAERARATIESGASAGVRSVQVRKITSSFGVATVAAGASSLQVLIDQADQALYVSKAEGRNRVTVWTPEHAV